MITEERRKEIFSKEYISTKELKEIFNLQTRQYASKILKLIKQSTESSCGMRGKIYVTDFFKYYKIKVKDGDFKLPQKPVMPRPAREWLLDGRKLRIARKKQGLSQYEIAERTGINQDRISRYEQNKYNPMLKTIERIAKALDISPDELLSDEILKRRKKEGNNEQNRV